jgi:hypothetical protein
MGANPPVTAPTLRVHVSTRAAILAGKTRIGVQAFEVTDQALATLSEAQRLEVALLLEGDPELGSLETDVPIVEPTIEAILPALEKRANGRAATEAKKKADEARAAEMAAEESRAVKAKEGARIKAIREWVAQHGDDEQKARMSEGYLREDEILEDVMDDVFDIQFPGYTSLRRGDACDCACAGNVEFLEQAPGYMDAAQFARLVSVRESAPEGATVEPVEHKAKCPACRCVPIARITARVSLPWHGWLLVRDYSLD